ncbi:MAG TPA: aldo/keto reductase [Acetobacteraceae bacterium]|nr:aldo/keto reductase [Acetobacteraceae bacterium]
MDYTTMHYTTLGRTGLRVSVAGLGAGGFSRLGLSTGKSEAEAVALVHAALDLGVNVIDTAAPYGTEAVVGKAIAGRRRDSVVIATKATVIRGGERIPTARVIESLDNSLRVLGVDCIDVFQLHAVPPASYEYVRDVVAPALLAEKQKGKFRFLGITETAPNDLEHVTVSRAAADGLWDVVMVAFHMMCQNARETAFPATRAHDVGTLMMFAVRSIFARPAQLAATMRELAAAGQVPESLAERDDPLGFLVHADGASSLTDAAYRFVRHEPGVDVVLFGTGEIGHLRSNVGSILKPPLPGDDRARLAELFGHLRGVGLDVPSQRARG